MSLGAFSMINAEATQQQPATIGTRFPPSSVLGSGKWPFIRFKRRSVYRQFRPDGRPLGQRDVPRPDQYRRVRAPIPRLHAFKSSRVPICAARALRGGPAQPHHSQLRFRRGHRPRGPGLDHRVRCRRPGARRRRARRSDLPLDAIRARRHPHCDARCAAGGNRQRLRVGQRTLPGNRVLFATSSKPASHSIPTCCGSSRTSIFTCGSPLLTPLEAGNLLGQRRGGALRTT